MVNTPSRVPRVPVPVAGTLPPRRTRRTLRACVVAAAATTCLAGGAIAATAAPASDAKAPAANPDVLVNVDHDLYLVSPDGSYKPRRLTTSWDIGRASFSPDRSRIVYSKGRDRFTNLYVMRSDGTGAVNLTSGSEVAELDPDWSPDGTQIVFWRVSHVAPFGFHAIAVMPAHKDAPYREVARSERDIRGCDAPAYGSPAWSPTRAEIAVDALCGSEGREVIAIFRPNGTLIKTIAISDFWTSGPTYDPTGDQLATADGGHLFRVNRATGRRTVVLAPDGDRRYLYNPVWSPDGRRIAYSIGNPHNGFDLLNVKADGTNARTIFSGGFRSDAIAQDW